MPKKVEDLQEKTPTPGGSADQETPSTYPVEVGTVEEEEAVEGTMVKEIPTTKVSATS